MPTGGFATAIIGPGGAGLDAILSGIGAITAGQNANELNQANLQAIADQLALARQQAGIDNQLRNRILTQTGEMRAAILGALAQMGPSQAALIDPAAVHSEALRRFDRYSDIVDQELDAEFSGLEADRIRAGVDRSTYDLMARGQAASAAAGAKQDAYTKAFDDALAYITGFNKNALDTRAGVLNEIAGAHGASLDIESGLFGRGLGTASNLFQTGGNALAGAAGDAAGVARNAGTDFGQILDFWRKRGGLLGGTGGTITPSASPGWQIINRG